MIASEYFIRDGFVILSDVYSDPEVESILRQIKQYGTDKATFRKSTELFAIRQFLKEFPFLTALVFNSNLKFVLREIFGEQYKDYFVVKSIYFDKPNTSNWYVAYHQDLTISVDKKSEVIGFCNWTIKQDQFAVQPPLCILQNIVTVRIHLDDTDENNGALKVIPGSHLKGICRPQEIDRAIEKEVSCTVGKGGIMLMKPLLLHSSGRTTNSKQRRVIHIELSNEELPAALNWSERIYIN